MSNPFCYCCHWLDESVNGPHCKGCIGTLSTPDPKPNWEPKRGPTSTLIPLPSSVDMKQHKHEAKVIPMLAAIAAVYEVAVHGGNKYVPGNERNAKAEDMEEYERAEHRHLQARRLGEVFDPSSGKRHLAHHAWNALFLLEQELRGIVNPQWAKEPSAELIKAAQKGEKK